MQCCSNKSYFLVSSGGLVLRHFQLANINSQSLTPSATTTSSPLPSASDSSGGQPNSKIIAVGLGLGIPFCLTILALIFLLLWELGKRGREKIDRTGIGMDNNHYSPITPVAPMGQPHTERSELESNPAARVNELDSQEVTQEM